MVIVDMRSLVAAFSISSQTLSSSIVLRRRTPHAAPALGIAGYSACQRRAYSLGVPSSPSKVNSNRWIMPSRTVSFRMFPIVRYRLASRCAAFTKLSRLVSYSITPSRSISASRLRRGVANRQTATSYFSRVGRSSMPHQNPRLLLLRHTRTPQGQYHCADGYRRVRGAEQDEFSCTQSFASCARAGFRSFMRDSSFS